MLQRMMQDLRGDAVLGRDGVLGAFDDVYFDCQCWQVRYVVIAIERGLRGRRLLVSAACLAKAAVRDSVRVDLSRSQIQSGGGAWSLEAASRWLDRTRVCSGRDMVGVRVEAQDGSAGRLSDLLVDDEAWSIDYIMVDTGNTTARELLVPLDWVGGMDLERRALHVERTCEQLGEIKAA